MIFLRALISIEFFGLALSIFCVSNYWEFLGTIKLHQGDLIKWSGFVPVGLLCYFSTKTKGFVSSIVNFNRWKKYNTFKSIYYINLFFLGIFSLYSLIGFGIYENQQDNIRGLSIIASSFVLSIYTGGISWMADIKLAEILNSGSDE